MKTSEGTPMRAPLGAPAARAVRMYRLLLRTYPSDFRSAFGREMELVLRDQCRANDACGVRFWAIVVWDVARSAPGLRVDALRARWGRDIHTREGKMRPMAIVAVLVGAFEALNALADARAGGLSNRDAYSLASMILALVAGALLVALGIALLRSRPTFAAWVPGAAFACLATFAFIGAVSPWMSIFARILGIGFPITLLLFLRWSRWQGPSVPMTS